MRGSEERLLAIFYVGLIGVSLFGVYYFNSIPGGLGNPVIVKIFASSCRTQECAPIEFLPQNIALTEGQHVTLVFDNNDDSPHELAIPALNVTTGVVNGGQTVKVNFVPNRVGTFPYGQPGGRGLALGGNVTVLAR